MIQGEGQEKNDLKGRDGKKGVRSQRKKWRDAAKKGRIPRSDED